MPSVFRNGRYIVQTGSRGRMNSEEFDYGVQHLIRKVYRKALGDTGDAFRGRPPNDRILCKGAFRPDT